MSMAYYFLKLPEDCIANIFSFTSPRDVCRSFLVSRAFRSAAEADAVWERYLPPDCYSIISRCPNPPPHLSSLSKKDLYFSLCNFPLLIDDGKKSFSLEKSSGKKCYMISARDLSIIWGDTPDYWRWIPLPEARFPEVAELMDVCWFEIRGKIDVRMLSPLTTYAAYLVFKLTTDAEGFEDVPVQTGVGLVGGETSSRNVYLDADPRERNDGWLEVELGDFNYGGDGQDGELEMSVCETNRGNWKSGFICEGIEIRPKEVIN
ncbi:F-box protein PP2-B10 [Ziziphus jujuba]|uniref:F-box protein PP2-B10 n=1 Tax=Ziziphus jujuba TaxID=326968 RepID=A0ABM3IBI7_ZIZJJ|nr:F-box protein PP2-B10 [Ziziphus jujuba]